MNGIFVKPEQRIGLRMMLDIIAREGKIDFDSAFLALVLIEHYVDNEIPFSLRYHISSITITPRGFA